MLMRRVFATLVRLWFEALGTIPIWLHMSI